MTEREKQSARATCVLHDRPDNFFHLSRIEIVANLEPKRWPAATAEVLCNGVRRREVGTGAGGLDALLNALNAIVGIEAHLDDLKVQYTPQSNGRMLPEVLVDVVLAVGSRRFRSSSRGEDIILACGRAYLAALEQCHYQISLKISRNDLRGPFSGKPHLGIGGIPH